MTLSLSSSGPDLPVVSVRTIPLWTTILERKSSLVCVVVSGIGVSPWRANQALRATVGQRMEEPLKPTGGASRSKEESDRLLRGRSGASLGWICRRSRQLLAVLRLGIARCIENQILRLVRRNGRGFQLQGQLVVAIELGQQIG